MTTNSKYYEGCGMEGPIRCIFLSEFHPTAGSKISCQVNWNWGYWVKYIYLILFHSRPLKVMLQRKSSMRSMFTLFQNPSSRDVFWLCKFRFVVVHPVIEWILFFVTETLWVTRLLVIQWELTVRGMQEMPFISICVLFVIPGRDQFNTNRLLRNLQSIWFVSSLFLWSGILESFVTFRLWWRTKLDFCQRMRTKPEFKNFWFKFFRIWMKIRLQRLWVGT